MAFLQNLIVTGSSKFLNKIYATDLNVTGAFNSSGALNVSGTSTLKAINGTSLNVSNGAISAGTIELSHATPYIDFHFGKSTTDYTSRIIESTSGTITISPNLKVGTSATIPIATITTANITTDNIGTGTANTFNVRNRLYATQFDLQSVAQLGGAFYVSPTLKFPTDTNTTFTVTKSGTTLNIVISDSAITSTTLAGVVWGANAKIKASGRISAFTTGTLDGTVTGINTSSHTLTISVSGGNVSSIPALGTVTSANIENFCVMMYETSDSHPVGIMMNSYGVDGRTYIDIHGGTATATTPNVRIGNLGGLSFNGSTLPNQWGIYTNNGYFSGSIIANGGKIGGFIIGETAIYTGTVTSNADNSIALSSADFTRTIGGTSRTGLRFAIGDKVGITGDGTLYAHSLQASGGKIGGWNIASDFLYNYSTVTTGIASTQYGFRLCVGTSQTNLIIRAGSRSYDGTNYGSWENKFYVRNDGYMFASAGSIASWTINTTSFSRGTWGEENGTLLHATGISTAKSIGGSDSISGWTITSGANFGVTKTGAVYCSDLHATGEITATSGYIGTTTDGFTIDSSGFYSGTKTANTAGYITLSNSTFSRTINGSSVSGLNFAIGSKFGITSDGTLYANGLNITGINADNITLGTVNVARLTSVEVGGRNFLLGTENSRTITLASATGNYYVGYFEESDYGKSVTNGNTTDYFTISFEWSTTSETGVAWPQVDGNIVANVVYALGNKTNQKSEIDLSEGSGKYVGVFRFTETQAGKASQRIRIRVAGTDTAHTAGSTFTVWNLKLEKGNMATQWVIAPEDIKADINDASKTAKNYLYYDTTNGLIISSNASNQTYAGASTGYNTRLTNSALEIRNGTDVLASYGSTVTIGRTNEAHQILDGSSLKFISNKGLTQFAIEDLSNPTGFTEYEFKEMEDVSSVTVSSITSVLVNALNNIDESYLKSSDGDYVDGATLSNVTAKIYLIGTTAYNETSGYVGETIYTNEKNIGITSVLAGGGSLSITLTSTNESYWTDLATELVNALPTDEAFNSISFILKIIYPTSGIAITFGSREKTANTKGIGSISMGENNLVAGKYSYAFGQNLTNYDNYSVVVGEKNVPIIDESTYKREEMAFVIGANGKNAFGVSKTGTMFFSENNCGTVTTTQVGSNKKATTTINFPQKFPKPPFVLVSLIEAEALNAQSNINDYGKIQIYVHEVTQTSLTVFIVNNGTLSHTVEWSWFAFCTTPNPS